MGRHKLTGVVFLLLFLLSCGKIFAQSGTAGGVRAPNPLTVHDVIVGLGLKNVEAVGPGSAGQCFISNGASSDPSYQTCPGGSGIVGSTASAVTVTAATTAYMPFAGGGLSSSTEANVDQAAPQAATISNLYVQTSLAAGAGNTFVITLRDAATGEALTCTISGASATSCNDTTHTFTPAQGDLLDWQVAGTGSIVVTPNVIISAQWGGSITSGSVSNCGTAGANAYYASTGTAVSCLATVVEGNGSLTLGTDNSVAGTLQLANSAANAHSILLSGATTTNTVKFFATVPTTTDLIGCVVSTTVCTLTDSGISYTSPTGSGAIVLANTPTLITPVIGAATGTSLLVTGLLDGTAPVIVTTGTTGSPGATYNHSYSFNEEGTAGTGVTYTLPTAAAGKQYCIANAYNGSNPNTGILTIATSASGQFIIFTDGTLSATGGNVTSGGAAADAACVVGIDATHWLLYVQSGTWTKH